MFIIVIHNSHAISNKLDNSKICMNYYKTTNKYELKWSV